MKTKHCNRSKKYLGVLASVTHNMLKEQHRKYHKNTLHICYDTGDSIKTLVAIYDRIFKIVIFRTYQEVVKLTYV